MPSLDRLSLFNTPFTYFFLVIPIEPSDKPHCPLTFEPVQLFYILHKHFSQTTIRES